MPLIDAVIDWFRSHPGYEELKRLFTELVRDAIDAAGVRLAVPGDLRETRAMLSTQIKRWREEWTAEGMAKGEAEGMAKGMAKGEAEGMAKGVAEGMNAGEHRAQVRTLLRLLERRFGPVPGDIRDRIEAADRQTLDLWLDRILDAPTRDAVFGS
ncbi:MAG: hypothetical protein GVY13_14430 [Alphaproteobacteria bacterium]|nr:hypothetical protein [Alphaproteobacteria bacterium]